MKPITYLPSFTSFIIFLNFLLNQLHLSQASTLIPPVISGNFLTLILTNSKLGMNIIDLYGTSYYDFNNLVSQWTVSGLTNQTQSKIFYCQTLMMMGGPGFLPAAGYFERTYTSLSSHTALYFSIRMYVLDNWKFPDAFQIQLDDKQPMTFNPVFTRTYYGSQICAESDAEDLTSYYVVGKVSHTSSSLKIRITSYIQQDPELASFGVREVGFSLVTYSVTESFCATVGGAYGVGNCQCNNGYYPSGSLCLTCHASCSSCFTSGNTGCYTCAANYYWSGSSCLSCPSNCARCSSSSVCTYCKTGYYLRYDGTCQATCNAPYVIVGSGDFQVCRTPCQASDTYMYWDDTCEESCDSPLQATTTSYGVKFCSFPCVTQTNFLYQDGSCSSSCVLQSRYHHFRKFCNPCNTGLALLSSGECQIPDACDPPNVLQTIAGVLYCQPACTTGNYYLAASGTCVSSCASPLIISTVNGVDYCNSPCPNPSTDYYYWNASCLSTCIYNIRTVNGYKFCDACSGGQYLYPDNTCKASCKSPMVTKTSGGFKFCFYPCGGDYGVFNTEKYDKCSSVYTYPFAQTDLGECVLDLSSGEYQRAINVANILHVFFGIISGLSILAILLDPHDARPLCLLLYIKMLEYFKFIQAKYPPVLQQVFNVQHLGLGLLNFSPDLPYEVYDAFPLHTIPPSFYSYGLHSSYFVNSWDFLFSLFVVAIVIVVIFLAEAYFKDVKFVKWLASKIKPAFTAPNILTMLLLTTHFIDIPIYTSIEFRSLHFTAFLPVFSFIIMLFINIFYHVLLIKAFLAFKEARKRVTQVHDIDVSEDGPESFRGPPSSITSPRESTVTFRVLFDNIKEEAYFQHSYLLIFIFRVYFVCIILGYFFQHSFLQSLLIIISTIAMTLYVIFVKPLKRLSHQVQHIAMEVIFLVANLGVFILTSLNSACKEVPSVRRDLGNMIIACAFAFAVFGIGCLLVTVIRKAFGKDAISFRWCLWLLDGPRIHPEQDSDRSFSDTLEQRAPSKPINTPKFQPFGGFNKTPKVDLDSTPPLDTEDNLPEHMPMDALVYHLEDPEPEPRIPTSSKMDDSKMMFRQDMSLNFGSRTNHDESIDEEENVIPIDKRK